MPTRNVYVSAEDAALCDRAAELAGGFSAAVAAGLKLFVAERERAEGAGDMKQIDVEVQDGPVVSVKRFTGRRILRYEEREGTRITTYRVYETVHGRLAVHRRDDPDWRALTSPAEDDPVWEDARTWNADWWRSGTRTLSVYPNAAAMAEDLPAALVESVTIAVTRPEVEELDI